MIEREFVSQKLKEFKIQEYVSSIVGKIGYSHTKVQRTPMGEKIIIFASRPGLIVGRKGETIKNLTKELKKKFNLENPQIEISEVESIYLDARVVAETIASSLEKFGASKFKAVGHKMLMEVMKAGALGVEILVSGKVPSSRAKRWRFYEGYMKKNGDIAVTGVRRAHVQAMLKSGVIGIQVKIMPPDVILPDRINILKEGEQNIIEEKVEVKKEEKPKKQKRKRNTKKKDNTKDESQVEQKNEVAEEKPETKEAENES